LSKDRPTKKTFYTYQWIDSDCLQAIGWPPLTFFDWLNLHFACRDRIGTGQNRPFYPCFGPHRGSWCGKNWFGMVHQIVKYVTQPLWPYAIQQQKRGHLYNGGELGFLGRMTIRGINLKHLIIRVSSQSITMQRKISLSDVNVIRNIAASHLFSLHLWKEAVNRTLCT